MSDNNIRDYYRDFHGRYGADFRADGYSSRWMYALRRILVDAMLRSIESPVHSLLDAGCGNGRLCADVIRPRLPALTRAHGIDFVESAVSEAAAVFDRAILGNVLELEALTSGRYDLVNSTEVFLYIRPAEVGRFFAAHAAVLEPRGLFLLTVPNLRSVYRRILRPPADLFVNPLDAESIVAAAEGRGLRLVRCWGVDAAGLVYRRAPRLVRDWLAYELSFLFRKEGGE
jgi:predicted TPR repeat methyltransferase